MRTSFAALTWTLLFCGAAGLSIKSSRPPKKTARSDGKGVDEDKVMLGGVPVYGYRRGLAMSRRLNRFKPGSSNRSNGTEASATVGTWIVEFRLEAVTQARLQALCDGIFAPCAGHGDISNSTGHVGFPYLVTQKTAAELNATLANVTGDVVVVQHDMPTTITDAHLNFSGALDDGREAAATWGLNRINKDSAPDDGFGVHVYVLDTGVRTTHSQFTGRAIPQLESLGTFTARKCECQNTTCAGDTHGHGTHCAGTIGGIDYGVVTSARIHAVKVLGDDGYGFTSWSITAQDWILVNAMRPAVVSMSLGGSGTSVTERDAIDRLVADGVVVVVAAGNEELSDACTFSPAFVPNAITVGSTTSADQLSWFTNIGTCIDILAPGSSIRSAGIGSDTEIVSKSGTSMACPHVSGAVAILFGLDPTMTPAAIIAELTSEAASGVITGVQGQTGMPFPNDTVNLLLQVDSLSAR